MVGGPGVLPQVRVSSSYFRDSGLADETQFIFETEIELEDSLPYSETLIESIDGQRSNDVVSDDDLDPFMFCSPRYFSFNEGTYDLMVNDLLGHVKDHYDIIFKRGHKGCTSH